MKMKHIVGRLADCGKEMLEYFSTTNRTHDKINNQVLFDELVAHFTYELEELSVQKRMLYPMSFNVLLHPDDYAMRADSFQFILPQIVEEFYKIIKRKSRKYPNFMPPAIDWTFQFTPCTLKSVEKHGESQIIEKGKRIATIASMFALDWGNNMTTDTNIHFSVKPQNSRPGGNNNINMGAIGNIEFVGKTAYSIPFDKNLQCDLKNPMQAVDIGKIKGLATLTYSDGGQNMHYEMKDSLIHISGSQDKRESRSIFKLPQDHISDSHVQIQYRAEDALFQIAAFGETYLNGQKMELSVGAPKWVHLSNHSQIFMNGVAAVEFQINV